MVNLQDISKVIRSKNASPFELTFDIILRDKTYYDQLKEKRCINKGVLAELYGIAEDDINDIIYFDPCCAIKVTLKRAIPSGSPGDTDVYGAQQHAPLLTLQVEI
ncbi:MAG: DUF4387 domain-containing protein [Deltaproteobacteria bacterium]|nr:DUF4387 domain-containing protein [Deltaproteobacteria bacterium]